MSIIIHHGANGSFKTSGAVQDYLLKALRQGRFVFTNIRGLKSLDEIEQLTGEQFPEGAEIHNVGMDDAESFRRAAVWFHTVPHGAMIIIDEAQAVYHRKEKVETWNYQGNDPDRFTTFEKALEMQRHRNWDVIFTTPNIAKLRQEIRYSAGRAYYHVSLQGKLPWLKATYYEYEHDPENTGKLKSNHIGEPRRVKISDQTFALYQSTSTGEIRSDQAARGIFGDPKLRRALFFAAAALCLVVYMVGSGKALNFGGSDLDLDENGEAPAAAPPPVLRPDARQPRDPVIADAGSFLTRRILYTGHIGRTYLVEVDGRPMTSDDLDAQGVTLRPTGCALELKDKRSGAKLTTNCYLDQEAADINEGATPRERRSVVVPPPGIMQAFTN